MKPKHLLIGGAIVTTLTSIGILMLVVSLVFGLAFVNALTAPARAIAAAQQNEVVYLADSATINSNTTVLASYQPGTGGPHRLAQLLVNNLLTPALGPATGTVDLSGGLANGAVVVGLPNHAINCTYVAVPSTNILTAEGTNIPVLTNTRILSVVTNFREKATFAVASGLLTIKTEHGLSGAVLVCYRAEAGAPKWGAVGLGVTPTVKHSAITFLPGAYQFTKAVGQVHAQFGINVSLEADATTFTVTPLAGTATRAYLVLIRLESGKEVTYNVSMTESCEGATCTYATPANTTFGTFAGSPLAVVHVSDDGSHPDTIGIVPTR